MVCIKELKNWANNTKSRTLSDTREVIVCVFDNIARTLLAVIFNHTIFSCQSSTYGTVPKSIDIQIFAASGTGKSGNKRLFRKNFPGDRLVTDHISAQKIPISLLDSLSSDRSNSRSRKYRSVRLSIAKVVIGPSLDRLRSDRPNLDCISSVRCEPQSSKQQLTQIQIA